MFMRLHNSFLRHVSSFHRAGVHQTLFIDFARKGTPGDNLVPPTKKEGCKNSPVSSLAIKYLF